MTAAATRFYVTGGTLRPDAPSYVARQADSDLYQGLSRGEFCYVLTSRQMGKSSLMVHTAARLRQEGVAVAILDLTGIGQNLSPEQWYGGLLRLLGRQLDPNGQLEDALEEFWFDQEQLGPLQRWLTALRELVLKADGRLVIFIDEIDVVRSLPFSTDEFFAGIRECYNRRTEDPESGRLTFCLLGVATPSDLIRDTRLTPFNIGQRIELTDFTPAEAAPLAQGLGREPQRAVALLQRVLYWTGGHPYLTQRLCQAAAEASTPGLNPKSRPTLRVGALQDPKSTVDRLCQALFLSSAAREQDNNLLFVRERLLRSGADVAALLDLYGQVRAGKRGAVDDTDPLVDLLRLSGIARLTNGMLRVRNRIYERVFDRQWVALHMPDAERRRQEAAFRRGLLRTAGVSAAIIAVVAGLAVSERMQARRADRLRQVADQQRQVAETERAEARRNLYAAQMSLAQQSWERRDLSRAWELLEAQRPEPGQEELRGFEWRYLWRRCRGEAGVTLHGHGAAIRGVAFSPDGKTVAAGDGTVVRLWDIASRQEVAAFTGHTAPVRSAVFSPDGKILAAGGDDQTVKLWQVATRHELATLKGITASPYSVAFAPDGRTLALGCSDKTVKLWEQERSDAGGARRLRTILKAPTGAVWGVVFSPDGKTLASGSTGDPAILWDVASGRAVMPVRGSRPVTSALLFSPDGKTLLTGSALQLWDLTTRRTAPVVKGRVGWGGPAAFSPDGNTLAVCHTNTVKLWNLTIRQEVATLGGATGPVTAVAFSSDGNTLASASSDGTVRLWHAAPFQETDPLRMVAVCSTDRAVQLHWRPLPHAVAYNLYRGPAGPETGSPVRAPHTLRGYPALASPARAHLLKLNNQPVAGAAFTDQDPGPVNSRAQTYFVVPVYRGQQRSDGARSQTVEGPPVARQARPMPVPPGWMACSINEGGKSGSVAFDAASGQITLRGSGDDIWDPADQFDFLSQPVAGDFQLTVAALTRPTATDEFAKAGLMVRESLEAGARHTSLFTTLANGFVLQWRGTANGDSDNKFVIDNARLQLPILLRLTRQGNTVRAQYSSDNGQSFRSAGDPLTFAPALPKTLYVGLAITAHNASRISEARFSGLELRKR